MRFLRFFVLFALSLGVIFTIFSKYLPGEKLQKVVTPMVSGTSNAKPAPVSQKTSLFVPYWTIKNGSLNPSYDSYLYFGITADTTGINTQEPGYVDLGQFVLATQNKEKILVVRLLDQKTLDAIFSSSQLKQKIIQDTISIAKKYQFSGVAIDLEYPSLAFSSVTDTISSVIADFAVALKQEHLASFATIYGDTFYRVRPFDVKNIGEHVDGVFIMAYDFHKAKGNPGPNFPLEIGEDESYSFQTMITDFSSRVPKEKLTVIFGMFGYDWKVSDKGTSLTEAEPRSTADIRQLFITHCSQKNCLQKRNASDEPFVTYTDADGDKHVVWYEDETSMGKKVALLKIKGIGHTAIWANGYF